MAISSVNLAAVGGEFDLINRFFATPALQVDPHGWSLLPNGDDCALLRMPPGYDLVCSTDTLVSGVHFPRQGAGYEVACRALAVSVSDLAAMGALPAGFHLGLVLDAVDEIWLADFSRGLAQSVTDFGMPLLGGNISCGDSLSVTLHVQGWVPQGQALLRSGARVGDLIFVSGCLGDAAAALPGVLSEAVAVPDVLKERYFRPEPRLALGVALRSLATACIDLSDGLLQDLGHICRLSGVGAHLWTTQLPYSEAFCQCVLPEDRVALALTGGDDYELCFTVPAAKRASVEGLMACEGLLGACVGEIVASSEIKMLDDQGQVMTQPNKSGYQHFK